MNEIERIMYEGFYGDASNIGDRESRLLKKVAKSLEDYVIKARIEGAEKVIDIILKQNFKVAETYIAQLNKQLQGDK